MEFFLNEWSLQSQFGVIADFSRAVATVAELIVRARQVSRGRSMLYRSERMENRSAIGSEPFQKPLHSLGKEAKDTLIDVIYNKSAPAPWQTTRISVATDAYHWEMPTIPSPALPGTDSVPAPPSNSESSAANDEERLRIRDVSDSSMAELAERLMRKAVPAGCLFNFEGSELVGYAEINISKNRQLPGTLVASFEAVSEFEAWLGKFRGAKPYDPATATDPPIDEETCLADLTQFEPTSRPKQHGRTLYEHRTTRDIYYVDNLHSGGSAHLEVFSRMGKHKGEASLVGKLDPSKRDKDKDYTLDS
jgi:hypothetical protein|nr:hypothetical protein [Kofleriaceae bacterium]